MSLPICFSAISSWASYSSQSTTRPSWWSRTRPVKPATAPSLGVTTASNSRAGSIGLRVSRPSSATGGRWDQGQLRAGMDEGVPVGVLLVHGTAQLRPHSGQPRFPPAELVEDRGGGAPLPHLELHA